MSKQRDELWHKNADLEAKLRDCERLRLVDEENKRLRD